MVKYLLLIIVLFYLVFEAGLNYNKKKVLPNVNLINTITVTLKPTKIAKEDRTISLKPTVIEKITDNPQKTYRLKTNGRVWTSKWSNRDEISLISGQRDPNDPEFIARGNGIVYIDGKGVAHLQGQSPRMYVYDQKKINKWNNVEIIVYAKRISETGFVSSQGIVIGARSEHQDATTENPCLGRTYYGRLLYDGRAVFQKEIIHEAAYSINKPTENNKAKWNTIDGSMPRNVWIGVRYVVMTSSNNNSVKLELYRDLTDGKNGGEWEKLAEYTDSGNWGQTNSNVDIQKKCGYSSNIVFSDPGTSIFIRNDLVEDVEYKNFSIRELE